ncbi:hypothetical protein QUF64_15000 [Anaerolineales bacterium HSG6]|nr:hypothetical protein [Anaerolineales bacterium HSG6]MDM8530154.1 hypothetical protein [Anaerolineales bacterium HSG25]
MSEELEQIFVSLVDTSWKRYEENKRNGLMDDLLVGAVIASNVEAGYALIDLESDGVRHYLRFEKLATKERLIFQLRNLTEDLVGAKVLGRHARVVMGYGTMTTNIGKIWKIFKDEVKSSMIDSNEPGVISFDADITAGYVYAQVPLLLEIDQYLDAGYQVNQPLLQSHIDATIHSLRKYLNGRLSMSGGA